MGLNVDQINAMKHEDIGPCVDKFMAENFSKVKNGTDQQKEAGIRKYTLHMIKSRLTSVKELLKKGEAFLLPIKVEVKDEQICFNAVFSVVNIFTFSYACCLLTDMFAFNPPQLIFFVLSYYLLTGW